MNEERILEKLTGCQLISVSDKEIVVRKDNKCYVLSIIEDEGGCCGYNEVSAILMIDEENPCRNPVITKVEMSYGETEDGERVFVTFFGENKKIAEIDSFSSSGSGWCYGACVSLVCKALEIDETLSSW